MEYRSPLNSGFSVEDSLSSVNNTPQSRGWSYQTQRDRPSFRHSAKKESRESVPIWQYYHPSMVGDPWRSIEEYNRRCQGYSTGPSSEVINNSKEGEKQS